VVTDKNNLLTLTVQFSAANINDSFNLSILANDHGLSGIIHSSL